MSGLPPALALANLPISVADTPANQPITISTVWAPNTPPPRAPGFGLGSKMEKIIAMTLFLLLAAAGRVAADNSTSLPRSSPEAQGISSAAILDFVTSADHQVDAMNSFMLVRHETAVANFYDAEQVRRIYYPELVDLLMSTSGAAKVVIFAHDVRSSDKTKQNGDTIREPVSSVHNDYTPVSAPQMVRENLPADEAERRLAHRFVELNIWKPIRGPVLTRPLAICDARSIARADLVPTDRYLKHEVYMMTHNPTHRWFYFPRMLTSETLLIKGYDSMEDGRARFTAHASFKDPHTPPDAPPRESIEARALLFFD